MKHSCDKYKNIQDNTKGCKIPNDEPVFLIRGQDKLGPRILFTYADLYELMGGHKEITSRVRAQAFKMREWQETTGRCKMAD